MSKTKTTVEVKDPEQFKTLVELLAIFSEVTNSLAALETEANKQLFQILEGSKANFALLQSTVTEAEKKIKELALLHPEWFGSKKTLTTPYGKVKSTSTTKLDAANEEVSIVLIEHAGERDKGFKAADYLHQKKSLNLEALEKLDDGELAKFRIKRIKTDSISVTPAKLDMGKAVEEAVQQEAA